MPKKVLKRFYQNKFFLAIFLGTLIFGLVFPKKLHANEDPFLSIVNPVRGYDFWESEYSPIDPVKAQKQIVEKNNLIATWLLRPDVVLDDELISYFQNEFASHELGIFFEVTPKLAEKARVVYPKGEKYDAHRFFLSGYIPEERVKLIDTAFAAFKNETGFFPLSIGAWHIDAFSANYMQEKYDISAVMLVADQYSTDRYRVWGGWWGIPYYPSKKHILIPAQSRKDKIDVVVTQWAVRDPLNGYGPGFESNYSVQPNDYTKNEIGQNISYFKKLLDIYLEPSDSMFGHAVVGLENELWSSNRLEFERQMDEVSRRVREENVQVLTIKEFSDWYKESFPELSQPREISIEDPLDSGRKATWIMEKEYRIGLIEENGRKYLRDFRLYSETNPESYLVSANLRPELVLEAKAAIDTVENPENKIDVTGLSKDEIVSGYLSKKDFPLVLVFWTTIIVGILTWLYMRFKSRIRQNLEISVLLLLGTATWSLIMVKSGLVYDFGMGFWGPNGHDGVWHIALINQLAKGSLEMPVFAGEQLRNYHVGFDVLLVIIRKITMIPIHNLYFQIIPPLLAFLIGILVYKFVLLWRKSKSAAFWATFFVYFGGSFGWLITLLRNGEIGGESMFWAQQAISTLVNPPFALSILLMFLGLILLIRYKESKKLKLLVLVSLVFGSLAQVKVYAGILSLGGLFVAGIFEYFRRKDLVFLKVFVGSFLASLFLFLPLNRNSSSLIVFRPFWFLETMMGLADRLHWSRFCEAMINYRLGNIWIKAIPAYSIAFLIFLVGNMGTRIIKVPLIIKWLRDFKKIKATEIFLLVVIAGGVVFPMFLLQVGTPWNTIQFFYYSLVFSGVLAGVFLDEWLEIQKSSKKKILVISGVFLLTIPTTMATLKHYLPSRPPAKISHKELEALSFLAKQPDGVVLTYPFDRIAAKAAASKPPRSLYLYESTAYVSAFGNKPVYLEDEVNLDITGYDWRNRREEVESFLESFDNTETWSFLREKNITYVYWIKGQRAKPGEGQLEMTRIFENSEVDIYKVD